MLSMHLNMFVSTGCLRSHVHCLLNSIYTQLVVFVTLHLYQTGLQLMGTSSVTAKELLMIAGQTYLLICWAKVCCI